MRKIFVKKGLRELWKYKFQYIFLIIILALGVSMYGSMSDLSQSREGILNDIYEKSNFMDVRVKVLYGITINQSVIDSILAAPGVGVEIEDSEFRLTIDVFLNHSSDKGVKTTKGIVMGQPYFDESGNSRDLSVNKPLFFDDKTHDIPEPNSKECISENKFAKFYELDEGSKITVIKGSQEFELTIIERAAIPEHFFVIPEGSPFPSESSLGVMIITLESANELYFGYVPPELELNDLVITLKNPDKVGEFKQSLEAAFEDAGIAVNIIEKEEDITYNFLYSDLESDKESMNLFPGIIFFVSAVGLMMVLRRMIRVHRSQIGVFMALGIKNSVILSYFATIGIFIGVFGTILGWIFAIPLNKAFLSLLDNLYGFPQMTLTTSYEYYIYAGIFSIILCLFCTILPTYFALRIKPIDAMQNREDISTRRIGKYASKIGRKRKIPVPLKLSLRNFLRRPGRSLTSIFGVALALALFLSFAILMDSVFAMVQRSEENSNWDYEVVLDGFAPENITTAWTSTHPEIEQVNPAIMIPAKVTSGSETRNGIIYSMRDVTAVYEVEFESGGLKSGQMAISTFLSEKLDVGVGDTVSVELPYSRGPFDFIMMKNDVVISGIHSNHIGYNIFVDLDTVHSLTNLTGQANVIYITTHGDEPITNLENTLITTPGVAAVTHIEERGNVLEQFFNLFLGVTYLMALLSAGLAMGIIYNLFMISAQENRRDYATMKTLGTSTKRLGYLILIEGAFISVFGIILGVLGGYTMAVWMMRNASDFEVWNMDLIVTWPMLLAGLLLIIIVVLMVSGLTIRYIRKIHIADVIRERST